MYLKARVVVPACLSLLLLHSVAFAQISFTTGSIARPGDPAPVPPQLVQVYSSSINDRGQVAFVADNAAFLQSNGATSIVAALGDPAPGGGTFITARMPSVNNQGQVAFIGTVAFPGRSGIFLWSEGGIRPIVQVGDPVPGGGTFGGFFEISIQATGDGVTVASSGYFSSGQPGLFLFSQGVPQLLARAGDPAPRGGTFNDFFFPVVNGVGQVAFWSPLSPANSGIFLFQPDGSITEIARQGDPSPDGGTFHLSSPDWSAKHQSAMTGEFGSSHNPPKRLSAADQYIGPRFGASRELLGDGAATISYLGTIASINDLGDVAFSAITSMFGRGGIFVFSGGQITRRIRELDPAPGGGVFNYLLSPSLNSVGQIAFQGYVSTDNGSGAFLFSPDGSISRVARPGQPSPEGDTFTYASAPSLNSASQVAFTGQLLNSLGGVYLFSAGEIARVAGQGDPIDREPKFIDAIPRAIDGAGRMLFTSNVFPGGFGLFIGGPIVAIARLGDPAPGGGVFNYFESYLASINATGRAVFVGQTTLNFTIGLYSFFDGALSRIAGFGDPAPGGGIFYGFSSPSISNAGDIAFVGAATFPSLSGMYLFSNGEFRRLLAFGDPAPGGGTFSGFSYLSLNNLLHVSFFASVTDPGRPGIFRRSEGAVEAIARTGDPAPGGGTFNFPPYASSFFAPSLNATGEVAFGVPLSTGGSGIFKFSGGTIASLVRPGDPAPRGGTIVFADTASLNDAGQVAFYANTTNTVGVFLFSTAPLDPVAVAGDPAPGGGVFNYTDVPRINAQTQVGFYGGVPDGYGTFLATPTR